MPTTTNRTIRAAIAALALCLAARPAWAKIWQEGDFGQNEPRVYTYVPPGSAPPDRVDTVIGEVQTHKPEHGDTFLDLARYYDLGFNEFAEANPGADEWIPSRTGAPLVVPTEFVLPCCRYNGIIVNIPEMRMYYFGAKGPNTVVTFPVGLGREDWKTPVGKFKIREKQINPTWVIPDSIRKERIQDKGFSETMIAGGDPNNPLGKYRMRLTLNMYGIHGTNIPWGVGMLVSHGCVRLYPEDIDKLYPMTPVGTEGELVYQRVKIGLRNGRIYAEVHKDLYGMQPGAMRIALDALRDRRLLDYVDRDKLEQVVQAETGVVTDVTAGEGPVRFGSEVRLMPASAAPAPQPRDAEPAPAAPAARERVSAPAPRTNVSTTAPALVRPPAPRPASVAAPVVRPPSTPAAKASTSPSLPARAALGTNLSSDPRRRGEPAGSQVRSTTSSAAKTGSTATSKAAKSSTAAKSTASTSASTAKTSATTSSKSSSSAKPSSAKSTTTSKPRASSATATSTKVSTSN